MPAHEIDRVWRYGSEAAEVRLDRLAETAGTSAGPRSRGSSRRRQGGCSTEQRLRTLEALEGLGAGFAIGVRDLDLRGAGDLLGADQAGHVRLIGTELYQRLWARALRRVRGDAPADGPQVELHLGTPFAIPADYVPEPDVRIALYRRLSTITGEAEVEVLAEEVADRFGPPPDAVRHLIGLAQLRQRCVGLEIARLEAGPKGIALEFREPAAARARLQAVTADAGLEWAGQPCRISSLW